MSNITMSNISIIHISKILEICKLDRSDDYKHIPSASAYGI